MSELVDESLLQRLGAYGASDAASYLGAARLINEVLEVNLDQQALDEKLSALVADYDPAQTPWAYLKEAGFGQSAATDVIAGSRLDEVLRTRRGLPITLGALLAHLAVASEQTAYGVNFPGHFLVRVGQSLVDPFVMESRSEQECRDALPEEARRGNLFPEARPTDVLLRMLNNLKYHYVSGGEFHRALTMVDCQLRVVPDHDGLIFEQGEYWLRLGSVQGARLAYSRASQSVDATIADLARQRLKSLEGRDDVLH